MIYSVEDRNDHAKGLTHIVSMPEKDLDMKAFRTLQEDLPPFIIPFRYRFVDDLVEFTFIPGDRRTLLYQSRERTNQECITLWTNVLQPLISCYDWFLKADSFVLESKYIYLSQDGKTACYLYLPTTKTVGESDALLSLVKELADRNRPSDQSLEISILRAINRDFQPKSFLQMLRQTGNRRAPDVGSSRAGSAYGTEPRKAPIVFGGLNSTLSQTGSKPLFLEKSDQKENPARQPKRQDPKPVDIDDGDIAIQLNGKKGKASKPDKQDKKDKGHRGFFFSSKKKQDDEPEEKKQAKSSNQPASFFVKQNNENKALGNSAPMKSEGGVAPRASTVPNGEGVTVLFSEDSQTGFAYEGEPNFSFPGFIHVTIDPGQSFRIGRFDVSLGRKQSDFEFNQNTIAVSRMHAAVERSSDGTYAILDLSSAAGTFVDGKKIPANVRVPLVNGCRVSFGNAGANYIWKC